jgi:hypothetical protein
MYTHGHLYPRMQDARTQDTNRLAQVAELQAAVDRQVCL